MSAKSSPVQGQPVNAEADVLAVSDGAFAVVNIQDNFGNRYTDADSTNYIPGSNFNDSASDNNSDADLQFPITVEGNGTLTFTFLDLSSGANDIYITFFGRLNIG